MHAALDGPAFKSWHFTIGYDRTEQHYPVGAYCWHAGDVDDDGAVAANLDLVGIEFLGRAGEALTPYQLDMSVRLTRWCAEQEGMAEFSRYPNQAGWTLAEHNEVSDVSTACPSNRIPWTKKIADLQEEEDEVTALQEVGKLRAELKAQQDFQNKLLVAAVGERKFLAGVAVNHEGRINELERPGR